MPAAYIVGAVRVASGKRKGALSGWHPIDLGAEVLDALVERTGIDGALVDDVIFGCVMQTGAQAGNIARNCVLASKHLPLTVPGTTVDRQCGSSQQAIHFAAQAVMSGVQDVVIAAGVEVMSLVPIGSNVSDSMKAGRGFPMTARIQKKWDVPMFSQFEGAELLAAKYGIERKEMEQFATASHAKALAATEAGKFKAEIVLVEGIDKKTKEPKTHSVDELIRAGTNMAKLSTLKTLQPGGRITAGISSPITDGAAALLICNEKGLRKLGVTPRAKFISLALAGSDPRIMLEGPIPATQKALARAGLTINDMDLYEVNEAFAPVPIAWLKATGANPDKLNVNGGAIALGHPLGGTGAKLMTTLLHELERRQGTYGLQAICEGGGTANATIIQRCSHPQTKVTSNKTKLEIKARM